MKPDNGLVSGGADESEMPEMQLFRQMLAGADIRTAMQALRDGGMKRNVVYTAGERIKQLFYENFEPEEDA